MPIQDFGYPTDEAGEPVKGLGTRPPPPGGGPGSGPPGSGGGFQSFSGRFRDPFVMRGLNSMGMSGIPMVLRKRGLMAGQPGRGDTVPAMLTPGEKVIPQNVSQNPAYEPALDALIAQGRMGMGMAPGEAYGQGPVQMAGGGEVPDMPMDAPGARPSRAIRLLQLLLELDEMDNVQGFAAGGTVQGFGQMLQKKPGAIPGLGSFPGQQQPPAAPGGWNRDSEGNVTNFNAQNPWGNYQGNQNAFGLGLLYRGVGNAGAQGAFDPRGNQALLRSQEDAARGDADALVRRNMLAADLGGLDPAQQAVAKLQALREAGRGVQDIMASVRAGAADRAQSFNEDLYRQLVTGGQQYSLNEQNARNERIAQQNQNANANKNWWQPIVGAGIGAAAGGFGGGGKKGG